MIASLIGASLLAAGPAAPQQALPGISDEETVIHFAAPAGLRDFHFGKGDVLFVRDRRNDWFRVQLNKGCLKNARLFRAIGIDAGGDTRLEANDRLYIGGRSCLIDSLRASEAPPQVDSKSIVTLD